MLCTNRYYDPQQGRFLTRDPLGYAGGVNLYGYTQNNPINWADPDGLHAIVTRKGTTVTITIPIAFKVDKGVRPGAVNETINSIQSTWSGVFGKYNVQTTVKDVTKVPNYKGSYDEVTIHSGNERSYCSANGYHGDWYSGDPSYNWVAAHEAGHLMGLDDQYHDVYPHHFLLFHWGDPQSIPYSGWDGNIMASRGGPANQKNVQGILSANGL